MADRSFISRIKKYSTAEIIEQLSVISNNMFRNLENRQFLSLERTIKKYGFYNKHTVILTAWDIPNIVYLAICNSNDYRGSGIKTEAELCDLINAYRRYEEELSNAMVLRDCSFETVSRYVWGMMSEQEMFQDFTSIARSFNRNYHILVASKMINRKLDYSVKDVIKEKFNIKTDKFCTILIILYILAAVSPNILESLNGYGARGIDLLEMEEDIKNVLQHYSADYETIRESELGKQIFYNKPFVRTSKKRDYLSVSCQQVFMLMGTGLYWLIRDYYCEAKSQHFVNAFGIMFEEYVEEISNFYLNKTEFMRLEAKSEKIVDFRYEFEDVVIYVEQKSGLLGINAKQQSPNLEYINTFVNRNIKEAHKQLLTSERNEKENKPVLKLILLYERIYNTQLIYESVPEIFHFDKRCYVLTIDEFEKLLAIRKNNRNGWNNIINKLTNEESETEKRERRINDLLRPYIKEEYLYFVNERDYLHKFMEPLHRIT